MFGCCSEIFGCSNKKKKFVVPNFVAVTKPFFSVNVRLFAPQAKVSLHPTQTFYDKKKNEKNARVLGQ